MKLKRLSLQGYKTFATRTEFIFDDGITAIVGPNGSGKSNIADAVRWVLGEQSYSTLRGKRTTDMIFAGSQSRPRAGMAQAILRLDNSEGWLPIDYAEVEIGRRAHRSGDNEYLLNGQRVRLKDIADLLSTSGLSQRTYTIIGQGLIDQALSLRADERRSLFEEAAGINHYKARRAETLRRLTETQHNLERIGDILAEIKPRLSSLKGQATRARNYEQISRDLRQLLRIWYGFKWEQAKSDLRLARDKAATAERFWQDSRQALLVRQQKMDGLQQAINRLQTQLGEVSAERDEARDRLERARREAAVLQERRDSVARQIAEVNGELPQTIQQQEKAETDLGEAVADLRDAQEALAAIRAEEERFQTDFRQHDQAIKRWQQALSAAEASERQASQRLAQTEGRLSQLQERLNEQSPGDNPPVASDDEGPEQERLEQLEALKLGQEKLAGLLAERQTLVARRREKLEALKRLRGQDKEAAQTLRSGRDRVARLDSRLELLNQLGGGELTVSDGVAGQVSALIAIDEPHKVAVSAALGRRLAAVVVEHEAEMWKLLEANDQHEMVAAVLAQIKAPDRPAAPNGNGFLGFAADVVRSEKRFGPLVEHLLGQVLLAADRPAAYALARSLPAGALAVAADGFVAYPGGLVEANSAQSDLLAQEARRQEALKQLDQAQETLQTAESLNEARQAEIQTAQEAYDELQARDRALEASEREVRQENAAAQGRVDRLAQQLEYAARRRRQEADELARLQERLSHLGQEIEREKEQAAEAQATALEARTELDALPVAEAQQQREGFQGRLAAAKTILAGRQAVVDSRQATLQQAERQSKRLRDRLAVLQEQAQRFGEQEDDQQAQWQRLLDDIIKRIEPLTEKLAENRGEWVKLQGTTADLQRHAHEQETSHTQTQIRLTQRESQIENLQERIRSDLGIVDLAFDQEQTGPHPLPLAGIVDQLPRVDKLPEDIEGTIHQYRGQMQRMGAVNPDAPREFEETEKRFEFLTQQVEDLEETEEQLRLIIGELDELTSKAFAETVQRVDEVFGDTFTQLFGGGSARLELTDPDDLTVSGVEIVARLPGRREQGLALLSGGERSLTASALIFSLLKVAPTPFCILDEVDAALDEANINRFRDLLRELSLKTQFIVITHNRGTVQVAQTLYGVSMQPDSSSQVISIKPEEYSRQTAD